MVSVSSKATHKQETDIEVASLTCKNIRQKGNEQAVSHAASLSEKQMVTELCPMPAKSSNAAPLAAISFTLVSDPMMVAPAVPLVVMPLTVQATAVTMLSVPPKLPI